MLEGKLTITKIEVPILARIEGEGALDLEIKDGRISKCELRIYEPPRYFEKFLEGREPNEIIDAVARICGICPIAYQAAFADAMETAFKVETSKWVQDMRLLMFLGEWMESHYLHIHLLSAPDFFGYQSGIEMAKDYPNEVMRGVKLQQLGNDIIKILGGRSVHPNGIKVGGFYRAPLLDEIEELLTRLIEAKKDALDVINWVKDFSFPFNEIPFLMVSLRHENDYPVIAKHIITSNGDYFHINEYDNFFDEFHVKQSTALHTTTKDGQPILLGPISRLNLNFDRLPPDIQDIAKSTGIKWPSKNMFHSIVARAIEGYCSVIRSIEICQQYIYPARPDKDVSYTEGDAFGAVEAPRGIQIDHIKFDKNGLANKIRISAPTSQNLPCIEADLKSSLEKFGLNKSDSEIKLFAEMIIRNYDPCVSCSAHFLTLNIQRI